MPTPGKQTSEYSLTRLLTLVLALVGLGAVVAAALIGGELGSKLADVGKWLLGIGLPALGGGYAVSRGLAKAGGGKDG